MGIFGGKTESRSGDDPSPTSAERAAPRAGSSSSSEVLTVIGRDTLIKGELTGDTDMLIEGRVEGRIHGAKNVIIGENGDVEARVEGEVVTVRGKVHGDCEATKKIEITSTGKVFGNIAAKAIVVAEGATFRGASRMSLEDPGSEKPVPASTHTPVADKEPEAVGTSSASSSTPAAPLPEPRPS